ncbi:hypothetical protein IG631_05387 [Alternaria alternata]|nr:hypothetical protein IG631_05387 [Alternaria alternata]
MSMLTGLYEPRTPHNTRVGKMSCCTTRCFSKAISSSNRRRGGMQRLGSRWERYGSRRSSRYSPESAQSNAVTFTSGRKASGHADDTGHANNHTDGQGAETTRRIRDC